MDNEERIMDNVLVERLQIVLDFLKAGEQIDPRQQREIVQEVVGQSDGQMLAEMQMLLNDWRTGCWLEWDELDKRKKHAGVNWLSYDEEDDEDGYDIGRVAEDVEEYYYRRSDNGFMREVVEHYMARDDFNALLAIDNYILKPREQEWAGYRDLRLMIKGKGAEYLAGRTENEQIAQTEMNDLREVLNEVVDAARAIGSTRNKNWWFCIFAPMAELNNHEESKSCFWDANERVDYKLFFNLMHQYFEEDTKDFSDEKWTASFSSEKKKWVMAGLLNRSEGKRILTPHECWGDYATRHQGRWTRAQAKKARTAYELWVALRSCVNSDNVISGT